MQITLEDYIDSIDNGLENALNQLSRAPTGSVISISDAVGILSIIKTKTMEAKLKILKEKVK